MATIHSLATETLSHILELAHDPYTPSTMKSAALVCRAWRDPAQRALCLDVSMQIVQSPIAFGSRYAKMKSREAYRRWETFTATRLHTPRQVELWAASRGGRVIAGRKFSEGLLGVRRVIVRGADLDVSFLSDTNLRGLEHLSLDMEILEDESSLTSPVIAWPANLRALQIESNELEKLRACYSPTTLELLTLTINNGRPIDRSIPFQLIPATVLSLSVILIVTEGRPGPYQDDKSELLRFFATVQHLHHFIFDFHNPQYTQNSSNATLIQSLVRTLPTTIKRLGFKCIYSTRDLVGLAISENPFNEIQDVLSNGRLPNLSRIDFRDCKRKDLEEDAAATDLLAECERQSIRIFCWEDIL